MTKNSAAALAMNWDEYDEAVEWAKKMHHKIDTGLILEKIEVYVHVHYKEKEEKDQEKKE